MARNIAAKLLLSWVAGLSLGAGAVCAKEPIAAPAEVGAIPSPRIVSKAAPDAGAVKNQELLALVEEAIEISSRRYLIANQHSPWQIYHGLNALRRDFQLELNGDLVNAVEWLSTTNPQFRDSAWFEKTVHGGRAHRYTVPYHFEGHPNQSLALMVMCNLPIEHRFQIDTGYITVKDIINNAKVDLNPMEEQTWTLWFLTHYLNSDETWLTRRGETWSIERLVQNQVATQVTKAACGGTHNLYALAVARNNHLRRGGQLRGVWLQADQKLKRHMVAAKSLQRRDGSYPTNYFRGYGFPKSFSEQIASTGHMMEWLVVAVDDRQFSEEWVERSIRYLAEKLIEYRDESAECGPLYHTVSALMLYRDRAKGIPWPDPAIQTYEPEPAAPARLAEAPKLPEISPAPGLFPTQTVPEPGLLPEETEDAPPPAAMTTEDSPKKPIKDPSVTEQSAEGKVAIGLDESEMELEFELPVKTQRKTEKPLPVPKPLPAPAEDESKPIEKAAPATPEKSADDPTPAEKTPEKKVNSEDASAPPEEEATPDSSKPKFDS